MSLLPRMPDGCRGQCKLNCIMQGKLESYPGNASTMEYFRTYVTEFSVQSKVALIDDERSTTFWDLDKISTKLALAIKAFAKEKDLRNYNPNGDWVIALCLPPSEALIFSMFAIHKLGAAYVPIDHTYPENRVVSMVTSCRPIMVISDALSSTVSKFGAVTDLTEVATYDDLVNRSKEIEATRVLPFPSKVKSLADRIAVIFYTSGSSGAPKGVRLKHSTIMNRLYWQWTTFPYAETDKCCAKTSVTFVDSIPEIFGPLLRGIGIHIFSRHVVTNPNFFIRSIHAAQITRILVVPSLLQALLGALRLLDDDEAGKGREKLDSIKFWICSSETLHRELAEDFFREFPNATLCNFYGSTEDMGDVAYEVFTSAEDLNKKVDKSNVAIGGPIFNTVLYVLNDNMEVTPEGQTGELYVAGYNLSSGYVGLQTSDKFLDNPFTNTLGFNRLYKTGDFVRIGTKYGRRALFFEGRNDTQVKVRGHRVDLTEIEGILNSQANLISKAVVLCFNPDKEDQVIVSFIIPAKPEVTEAEISSMLKNTLKTFEIPEVKLISEVPLLLNGKIDRQKLLAHFETERRKVVDADQICVDPWSKLHLPPELEEQAKVLVQAISDVTHLHPSDIIDNFDESFFNLGGTSLNSVAVVTRLRLKKFHIGLDEFVSAKSLKDMLPRIVSTVHNKPGATINTGALKHHHKYYSEFLASMHEIEATAIIADSFSRKGDLEVYTNASHQDFKELMRALYPTLQKKGLSFIVRRREDKKAVAVALNFDLYDEPKGVPAAPGIQTVLDFLDFVEAPSKLKLPKGRKKIIHSFMMGTHELVTEADNVPLMTYVEEELIRIGKDKKFIGIMTTNTNALSIELCSDVLGYETLIEYQINRYTESDGSKPFRLAPDTQIVRCCWKRLQEEKIRRPMSSKVSTTMPRPSAISKVSTSMPRPSEMAKVSTFMPRPSAMTKVSTTMPRPSAMPKVSTILPRPSAAQT